MDILFYSSRKYDQKSFKQANENFNHNLNFIPDQLTTDSAKLAAGHEAVCCFVNDPVDKESLKIFAESGVKLLALRSAGFNNVDLKAAAEYGIKVSRVPQYSPDAVAEYAATLVLALVRKVTRAYIRVRESNFTLDGLLGFNLSGKTVGIIGLGRIGLIFARIMKGFSCNLIGYDLFQQEEFKMLGGRYASLDDVISQSSVISLHCPLLSDNFHLISNREIKMMRKGAFLINTSRGPLVDTKAVIAGLSSGHLGGAGFDVYEGESKLYFQNHLDEIIQDSSFLLLRSFPNVIITAHQAFLTEEALSTISNVTLSNITAFEKNSGTIPDEFLV